TFEKFPQADARLTTQMKSVGEVMAIGRTFQESFQKALRGMETDIDGMDERVDLSADDAKDILRQELTEAKHERILYVADGFRFGMSREELFDLTSIDPWFLNQIEELVIMENKLKGTLPNSLSKDEMYELKRKGFSDRRLATLLDSKEKVIRKLRQDLGVRPIYKRVDTCAAEFSTDTAYMYSSYDEECESNPSDKEKIMVLGGGPNRIGQGIEFDYCCVHAALSLRDDGYETIMVNCNPETVSTDYDTSDRLYFEPLTLEDVLEIVDLEKPKGVIVQYGGQTPLKLAEALEAAGAPIIGTSPDAIDLAEDRERFQQLTEKLGLKQPPNRTARNVEEGVRLAEEVGYPLVVRPSYVLGGRAMEIVHDEEDLRVYMRDAVKVSNDSPVLLDRFLDDAIEVDVDAICDGTDVLMGGIMQHIEQAGVHSGDSACSLPPYSLSAEVQDEMRVQTKAMALALNVIGLMNVQFAIQTDDAGKQTIYVLEVNPRASRTVPYVSKATGRQLAKVAARCMAGQSLKEQGMLDEIVPDLYFVKEAVFPFIKFPSVDPILGPEMKSTGEVMGIGKTFAEAYGKSQRGASVDFPKLGGTAFISVREADQKAVIDVAKLLTELKFKLVATRGTARTLEKNGFSCEVVNKVREGRPHIVDLLKNDQIDLIVNTTEGKKAIEDSSEIRRVALRGKVAYTTTITGAWALCQAMMHNEDEVVYRLQDLH
ncbi:MAG TPA: carbamoyl-phosphate synthase large subunit, partial [Leucothrix sp.]|nr:carbamoyl-phosphate synthase large subunit [Leucothrix sp.]